jgi:hypothetical protein
MAAVTYDFKKRLAPGVLLGRSMAFVSILLLSVSLCFVPGCVLGESRAITNIMINEVLYDPLGSDVDGEFVELYNPTGNWVYLEGWALTDRDGTGPEIVFHGLAVPGQGYLVVFTGAGTNDTDFSDGIGRLYLDRNEGLWSNTGDDVLILNKTGGTVDYMSYGDGISVDPPPADTNWSGTVPLVPEGYSIGRLPDGNGTSAPNYYRPLKPTPGKANQVDLPPEIQDWDVEPGSPMAFQELLVWSKVIDGVKVDKVQVHTRGSDGIQQDLNMTWAQARSRYEAVVQGRVGGQNLELWILAFNPLNEMTASTHQNRTFRINASTQLIGNINGPEDTVLPGAVFHVQGHILWKDGSKVNGNILVMIPDTRGSWSSSFEDYIDIPVIAPRSEGTYEVDIQVRSGEALIEKTISVEVRWPFKTLQCSLSVDPSSGSNLVTGQDIFLNGTARFSDGLPASGAKARLSIDGTGTSLDLMADEQGNLRTLVKTPSISGTYDFDLVVQAMGKSANFSMSLTIVDHLTLNLSALPKLFNLKGELVSVSGKVSHHDDKPASNSIVVIEFLGTAHKVRTYTDLNGNFNADMITPYYTGQYELRVTAVSGDSLVQKEMPLFIGDKTSNAKPTPGLDAVVVVLGVLIAIVLCRKR